MKNDGVVESVRQFPAASTLCATIFDLHNHFAQPQQSHNLTLPAYHKKSSGGIPRDQPDRLSLRLLYLAVELFFWQREEEQVREERFDPLFRNLWDFRRTLGLESLFFKK